MTTIPYGSEGVAAFEKTDSFSQLELFANANPVPLTKDFPVAASTDLAKGSVVGVNGSGDLVLAVLGGASPIAPIGVLAVGVTTGVGVTTRAPVYMSGSFNRDSLVYDASYNTDAKKEAAFNGAATPTNIFIRARK